MLEVSSMMSLVAFLVSAGLTPYLIRRISENYRAAKARKAEMDAIVNTKKVVEGIDIKTLVAGQDVYLLLPPYPYWFCGGRGKVVNVTPSGVDVQTERELLRFDTHNIPVFIVGQTALVVGQEVDVAYCQRANRRGKVVKVMPSGVEVEVADLLSFDSNGRETDASRRERLGFGPTPGDRFLNFLWHSAPEFGPWNLDDMPFAERTALLEQARRDHEAKRTALNLSS
jgi:hypothetical protein